MIHCELYKKLKFDHMNNWCMHSLESVLENERHKFLWDFEIQRDHLILARWPDLVIGNKKKRTCKIVEFAVPADHIEVSKMRDKYLDLAWELKKPMEHESDINCNLCTWDNPQRIGKKGLKGLGISGQVETIQITALFRSARILRRILETWGDLLSLKLEWKTISECRCENLSKK